jgi:DNA-binding PadR family transcriptional regulator
MTNSSRKQGIKATSRTTQRVVAARANEKNDQELYGGLIRLHILHHAAQQAVFGLWLIEELQQHGYRIGPGTLYPILHGLEKRGLLRSTKQQEGSSIRRMYSATGQGRRTLERAKTKVRELFGEILEDDKVRRR